MSQSDFVRLNTTAKERAVVYVLEQMYRHQMRYQPKDHQEKFDLPDYIVQELEEHYRDVDKTCRLVVVNLSQDYDLSEAKKIAMKCSSKCYVDDCLVTFEMGDSGDHPHYNFLFKSSVEWLARSRLIFEFSRSFKIAKNFVKVRELSLQDYNYKCADYIKKEGIWSIDKRVKGKKR